ncbi:SGNH/GDSL hydrolase family protein [Lutimonas halocynthiae]|uniref:SGNH/GDSL hydrolase family protein n=1 Tax=Lutimonas halocynthiae TaxID=1446477 RepID=UPI0025B48168|nr:SGNH/GDSL hydrolase family protein [Lutimonas halocynthiae]MDN3641137.1 SGNH/GDSL hydrolase family protein [Lutimonas halocynthiae]
MNTYKVYLILFATLLILVTPLKAQEKTALKDYKVLFVGNSLSYSNNLPLLVSQAASDKDIIISTEILAKPNYALVDHWDEGELQAKIRSKAFDFVIVQQGPSSQPEGRKLLFKSIKKLHQICEENQIKLAVFMVWPSKQYYQTFDKVIKNHREVAEKYNTILCPVGEIWKAHFDKTNDFEYYSSDGFHPSLKGSQVAAQIIVDSLFE